MFTTLEVVNRDWNNNQPIVVIDNYADKKTGFLALPALSLNKETWEIFIRQRGAKIYLTTLSNFFNEIQIPTIHTILKGASSRYPLLSSLDRNSMDHWSSFSIGFTDLFNGKTFDERTTNGIIGLVELIDDYLHGSASTDEVRKQLSKFCKVPGDITLTKPDNQLLIQSNHISNILLSLSDIVHQQPIIIYLQLTSFSFDESEGSVQIEKRKFNSILSKDIVNLWKGVKKLDRSQFLWMKK